VKIFSPTNLRLPHQIPSSLPLHSGGAWLWGWFIRRRISTSPPCGRFKDRSRTEAPSSLFAYLGNAYNSTTRLNDGIFTVHRFSVATSARLHKSECVFRFYVYGGIFDNPPGLLSARGTDCFCFFFFSLFCLNVNSGALIPRRSTAYPEGRRISFV
jgi:hypothetical protein